MNGERRAVRRPGGAGVGGAGPGVAGLGVRRERRLIWRERCQACRAQPLVCRERPLACRARPLAWQVRRLVLLTRRLVLLTRPLVFRERPLVWQVRRLTHEAFCDGAFDAVTFALADVALGAVAYVACGELTRFRSFRSPHRRSHRTGSRATSVRVPRRSALRVVPLTAQTLSPHWFARHIGSCPVPLRPPRRPACRVVPPVMSFRLLRFRRSLPSRSVLSCAAPSSPHHAAWIRPRVRPAAAFRCSVLCVLPFRRFLRPWQEPWRGRRAGADAPVLAGGWCGRSEARERQARLDRAVGTGAWAVENRGTILWLKNRNRKR